MGIFFQYNNFNETISCRVHGIHFFLGYPEHIEYYQPHNFLSLFAVDSGFLVFKVFKIKLFKFRFSKHF